METLYVTKEFFNKTIKSKYLDSRVNNSYVYTNNRENLITSSGWIVFMDTFIAVLAGLLIFPAIFSFGLSPESGPNLIFITMTSIFSRLYYGEFLGVMFFLLLFLAGFK